MRKHVQGRAGVTGASLPKKPATSAGPPFSPPKGPKGSKLEREIHEWLQFPELQRSNAPAKLHPETRTRWGSLTCAGRLLSISLGRESDRISPPFYYSNSLPSSPPDTSKRSPPDQARTAPVLGMRHPETPVGRH